MQATIWTMVTKRKLARTLARKSCDAGGGGHALGVEDLVANFASPCLVESADGGEHGGYAEDTAGDGAGEGPLRIKGHGEEHDDEQGKEEHGVDGVFGTPLNAEVFDEVSPEGAVHWSSSSESVVEVSQVSEARPGAPGFVVRSRGVFGQVGGLSASAARR